MDVFETPQFMYMLIAMTLFQNYDKEVRLDYVKRYYDNSYQLSKLTYQHQSWQELELHSDNLHHAVLVDSDDSLPSIFSSDHAIGKYVSINEAWNWNQLLEELEVLVQKLVVKSSILELFHSLRSSNQQLGVVHKTSQRWKCNRSFPNLAQEIEDILVLKKQQRNRRQQSS